MPSSCNFGLTRFRANSIDPIGFLPPNFPLHLLPTCPFTTGLAYDLANSREPGPTSCPRLALRRRPAPRFLLILPPLHSRTTLNGSRHILQFTPLASQVDAIPFLSGLLLSSSFLPLPSFTGQVQVWLCRSPLDKMDTTPTNLEKKA